MQQEVWNRFCECLRDYPKAGADLEKLAAAGCDPLFIQAAVLVTANFARWEPEFAAMRQAGKALRARLEAGSKGAKRAAAAYRSLWESHSEVWKNSPAVQALLIEAEQLDQYAADLEKKARGASYSTKRQGVSGLWFYLAMAQDYVRQSGASLSYETMADLVEVARTALGQPRICAEADGELIRKNVTNFRKRNPFFPKFVRAFLTPALLAHMRISKDPGPILAAGLQFTSRLLPNRVIARPETKTP